MRNLLHRGLSKPSDFEAKLIVDIFDGRELGKVFVKKRRAAGRFYLFERRLAVSSKTVHRGPKLGIHQTRHFRGLSVRVC